MPKLLIAAVLAAAALSSPALAASDQAPSRQVSTAGVDFTDHSAVVAFHARLKQAAASVCNTYSAKPWVTAAERACAVEAVDKAVRAANRPMLYAVHEAQRPPLVYAQR